MDAPADYVVPADDGSGWSFDSDMSQLMTDVQEEDNFQISKPPQAINVLLRQIDEKYMRKRRAAEEELRY